MYAYEKNRALSQPSAVFASQGKRLTFLVSYDIILR